MSYPSYLIHFNPNHDPKTGRFTYVKNPWAIRKGYQNKDGTISELGKKALQMKKDHIKYEGAIEREANKLFKQSKYLREGFGNDYGQVDDEEYFEYVARDNGLDTTAYAKAVEKKNEWYKKLSNSDSKLIQTGYEMTQRMRDLDPKFYEKELGYNNSKSDSKKAEAIFLAVMGLAPLSILSLAESSAIKKEEELYRKAHEEAKNGG